VRYFDHQGEGWTMEPEIKKMCAFRRASLSGTTLPFNRAEDRFDVIFLGNVMLYFSLETCKILRPGFTRCWPLRKFSFWVRASSLAIHPSGPRC
jgi:chemotaxis methyl-accepting protein methylase